MNETPKSFVFGYKVGVGLSFSTMVLGSVWLARFLWGLADPKWMILVYIVLATYCFWAIGSVIAGRVFREEL